MRRKYISQSWKYFLAAAVLLCFTGCGRQEPAIPPSAPESIDAESSVDYAQGEKQQENMEEMHSMEQSAQLQQDDGETGRQSRQEAVLSKERTTAEFDVGSFFELNLVVGDDGVYGYGRRRKGEKSILFQAGAEDGVVRDFDMELEPGISVRATYADSSGNLHMLLSEGGYSEWTEILALDKSGQAISRIDVSGVREEKDIFGVWMAIGADGNYYISCAYSGGSSILVVDNNGSLKEYLTLDVRLVWLGTGRSGRIYGIVYGQDGQYLAMLAENGEMEPCPNGEFQGMPIIIDCLRPGVECELLLGNRAYGAWAYEDGSLEQIVTAEEMPYQGQDVEGFGFLNDGRMCITGYRDGTHTIECLPAEREAWK